ncbi:MAG: DUF3536 domain-containing protein [Synergistaceae bacterium]|jgi:alpha-amylase/alpha-mannosidase (GH57 family)|nr:DUF3536 domain-containing protein [Synergistaceae bacterium]
MARYVCVHGHFYQPPRENPWLEIVEIQESAAPWHDWNERVTAECYRRNTASRILDREGNIRRICNNYSRMSFNMGPTLLSWMKMSAPRCYREILEADAAGQKRFSGHGPALAQVYSHMIMPLATRRDKTTQVKWGIEDFKSRFGRAPEGMWLAETAVDTETLEVLAENGILFTILAPRQAGEVRKLPGGVWQSVRGETIDTSRAYRCDLPSGKKISIFFYDGALSQAIAFGGMLNDGGYYARRLIDAQPSGERDTLSHVATDGESYGHHHDHGDMALAYCLETIDDGDEAKLTIYGEFLEKCPPEYGVRIVENSSWSCAHGVERWRADCGCSSGTPGFSQKWRAPLREALDWLRDKIAVLFELEGKKYLRDPWRARDAYIQVILDRSRDTVEEWLDAQAAHPLTAEERICALKLLEAQRSAILMYTSCGWFFDEISGLETTQILRYSARAIGLMRELTGLDYDPEFSRLLAKAPSNVLELKNGSRVYDLLVKPSHVSFERLAAHYGMSALFPDFASSFWDRFSESCWDVTGKVTTNIVDSDEPKSRAFTAGEATIASRITLEEKEFIFAANYFGDTSLVCGVVSASKAARENLLGDPEGLRNIFSASIEKKIIEIFGHNFFSLRHILSYAQRAMLNKLLQRDTLRIESSLRDIVHDYHSLFEYLATLNVRAPAIISSSAAIVLTADVVRDLEENIPDIDAIRRHMNHVRQWGLALDSEQIEVALNAWTLQQMHKIHDSLATPAELERVCDVLTLFMDEFKWRISLYEAQNLYHATQRKYREETGKIPSHIRASFRKLGERLKFSEEVLI